MPGIGEPNDASAFDTSLERGRLTLCHPLIEAGEGVEGRPMFWILVGPRAQTMRTRKDGERRHSDLGEAL